LVEEMGYNRILTREAKWWRYKEYLTNKEKKVHVYDFVDKKRQVEAATYEEVKRNVEKKTRKTLSLTTVKRAGKSTKITSKKRKRVLKSQGTITSKFACFCLLLFI
jgi:hypothetical protein